MNVMENICRGFIVNLAICFIISYIYIYIYGPPIKSPKYICTCLLSKNNKSNSQFIETKFIVNAATTFNCLCCF